jgi:hypothetical protein
MSRRITTTLRAGHCMSPQTLTGFHPEPDCWNIQTEVVMSILADEQRSMAVDLLLATSELSPEL